MKEILKNSVLPGLIITLLNFLISIFSNYYNSNENGILEISEPIELSDGEYLQTIIINNFSNTLLGNIKFYQSDSLKVLNIEKSNFDVELNKRALIANEILPKSKNTLIIHYLSSAGISGFVPVNFEEIGLIYEKNKTPFLNKIKTTFFANLILFFFIVPFFIYFENQAENRKKIWDERLRNAIEASQNNKDLLASARNDLNDLRESYNLLRNKNTKTRLLLFKHVRDLKKENEFYRYSLKRLLDLLSKADTNNLDIPNLITNYLKTHSTKSVKIEDSIEYIDIIEDVLKEKSKEKSSRLGVE